MTNVLTQVPDGFVTNFSRSLALSLKGQLGLRLADLSESDLAGGIEAILRESFPRITLSNVQPDNESILAQLMSVVEKESPWTDTDISATGQMLLRMISAVGAMNQFAIARAAKDTFHFTARSDTAVMTSARDLGNRLTRAKPASALATISRGDPGTFLTLPSYTQLQATDGTNIFTLFNRDAVTFGDGDINATVRLYEGEVFSTSMKGVGLSFETFEIGNETDAIADEDIRVTVNGLEWKKCSKPLWQYGPTDQVFWESTLPNGNIEIMFGDSHYGAALPANAVIDVQWIETAGSAGNSSTTNIQLSIRDAPSGLGTVTGTLVTTLQNGMDKLSADYFRLFASDRAASRDRMVRRADYSSLTVGEYPGVYDARFLGQAEIAPTRPSMMNIVHAVLLTDPVFTEGQWLEFEDYVKQKGIFQTKLVRRDPTPMVWNVAADIFCDPAANLTIVGQQVAEAVRSAFDPAKRLLRANRDVTASMLTLGFSWYMSDLSDLLKLKGTATSQLIEYVKPAATGVADVQSKRSQLDPMVDVRAHCVSHRRGGYSGRLDGIGHTISYDANGLLKVD